MTWQDAVNGSFEFLAAIAILNHCRVLYAAKRFEGVSLMSTGFFWAWGVWNCYYYPHLDQWLSFAGGIAIMSANFLWLGLMLHYRRLNQKPVLR